MAFSSIAMRSTRVSSRPSQEASAPDPWRSFAGSGAPPVRSWQICPSKAPWPRRWPAFPPRCGAADACAAAAKALLTALASSPREQGMRRRKSCGCSHISNCAALPTATTMARSPRSQAMPSTVPSGRRQAATSTPSPQRSKARMTPPKLVQRQATGMPPRLQRHCAARALFLRRKGDDDVRHGPSPPLPGHGRVNR